MFSTAPTSQLVFDLLIGQQTRYVFYGLSIPLATFFRPKKVEKEKQKTKLLFVSEMYHAPSHNRN